MSVETDFYSAVTGNAGMAALIGTRLYPQNLPPDVTFPAIAYRVISRVPYAGNCKRTRIQADVYATTYDAVLSVRDALETLCDATLNWMYVEGPDLWQDGQEIHHRSIDVVINE